MARSCPFDTTPVGDWNLGHLRINDNSKFALGSTERAQLGKMIDLHDARPAWHDTKVELTDLLDAFYARGELRDQLEAKTSHADGHNNNEDNYRIEIQCLNHLAALALPNASLSSGSGSGTTPTNHQPAPAQNQHNNNNPNNDDVIGIWAWQPSHAHDIASESHIYSLLQARDPRLAPRFLGHIVDNKGTCVERVVGFMLERVDGGDVRQAGPGDCEGCREALGRLGRIVGVGCLGLRKHSLLVRAGGKVVMQGFGGAFEMGEGEGCRGC